MSTVVVYVHGLWFSGREALLLRRRLAQDLGAADRVFRYPSVSESVGENAAALGKFLASIHADTVHLVGHSLGGIVIVKLFDHAPPLPPGRIVLLGSPLNGSHAGRLVERFPFGAAVIGRGMRDEVVQPPAPPRRWRGQRDLGVIAGDLPFGLGRLVGRLEKPNDGTVSVAETRLDGATEQIMLPVTHTGLIFSAEVARQTAAFLRSGHFARQP